MGNPVAGAGEALITANAIRSEVRDQNLGMEQDTTSVAAKGALLGQSLGNVLHKYLTVEQANFIEQKKLDAAARQGQDRAINSVDKEAERTGWKQAIFGQDEGYEVAATRAAENSIRDSYLEEATTIDQYAGVTPEQYKQRLAEKLDGMLAKNPDDKLYRQGVTDAWTQRTEKLVAKQYEANVAYNQLTARANADRQIRQELDEVQVDFQSARGPEETAALHSTVKRILSGDTLPASMHPVAKRKAVNDTIFSSISQGNIGVYNVMKQMGLDKQLDGEERAQLDRALGQYTQDWGYDLATKFEEAELAATDAGTNLEAARAVWTRLDGELTSLKLRSADTPQARSILARYFSASAGKRAQIDEVKERILTQGATVDAKAMMYELTRKALRDAPLNVPGNITAVEDAVGPVPTATLVQAQDANFLEDIKVAAGGDDNFDNQQAVGAILTDPKIARIVGNKVKSSPIESTLVKRSFEHVIGGYSSERFQDPDSKLATPALVTAVGNLRLLATNNSKIPLKGDSLVAFGLLERGINNQKPVPQIEAEINAYLENKDKDGIGAVWPIEKQEAKLKLDYVADIVESSGGGRPTGSSLLDYMDTFKTGLVINGGDFTAAGNYLRDFTGGKNLTYRGKTIVGGKKLDELTGEYPFNGTMEWLQKGLGGDGATHFQGYMTKLMPGKEVGGKLVYPKNLGEVGNWNMKVEEGFDGVVLYLENGNQPWRISRNQLANWSRLAKQDREVKEAAEAAKFKAQEQLAHQTMWVSGR